jgi:hypothetical protein
MTWIRLTSIYEGRVIRVRVEHISGYYPAKHGTVVNLLNGDSYTVQETPEYIDRLVK